MYAVLDIESTGGKYNEEGITEIAIYKFDGEEIVDQFISLVNPEKSIQPFVVKLTGINNKMLVSAPKFFEVAKRIIEITSDCILVAHNAEFDYRILRLEFDRLGYKYQKDTICTVNLSKNLLPDKESYKLGKLTKALGIPLSDRHRASGDALATVKLFKILLNKDVQKEIVQSFITSNKNKLKHDHKGIIDELPTETGVYYIHNENGKIIYIGKSNNIKSRLRQHLTSEAKKSKKIQRSIYTVTYELTGSELIALLKENEEIKTHRPKFNYALKQPKPSHGLIYETNENGYIELKCIALNNKTIDLTPLITYNSKKSLDLHLTKLIEIYNLCSKLCNIDKSTGDRCFNSEIDKCKGACTFLESTDEYNSRVNKLINNVSFDEKSFVIVDKGRNINERSIIYIKEGKLFGIGYTDLNFQFSNKNILENIITPIQKIEQSKHIVLSYLRKHKNLKIFSLNENKLPIKL